MPIVETTAGRVRGAQQGGVVVFKGIPYAAPPVGALRFRAPRDPEPWSGVRDALEYGAMAMQPLLEPPGEATDETAEPPHPMSEDCLVLNVWTAAPDAARRPVMVWIHGGAFAVGCGDSPHTDGTWLAAAHDVVVVTINHRLNLFGHLFLGGIGGDEYADSGNAGLLDIVASLRWVRDNIARFGGDPDNVTVFGNSGGGWKISMLFGMPAADGLFHKAILQSGSMLRALPSADADRHARVLLAALEIPLDRLDLLRDVSAQAIVDASLRILPADTPPADILDDGTLVWPFVGAPVVDGDSLPRDPFLPGAPTSVADIPILVGTTRDEFATLASQAGSGDESAAARLEPYGLTTERARSLADAFHRAVPGSTEDEVFGAVVGDANFLMPAMRQIEAVLQISPGTVYCYLFDWGLESAGDKALHGYDVPFVFGNATPILLGTAHDDSTRALARTMSAAWASFARNGDPGHPGLPEWPAYNLSERPTMVLDRVSRVENDPTAAQRNAFEALAAAAAH